MHVGPCPKFLLQHQHLHRIAVAPCELGCACPHHVMLALRNRFANRRWLAVSTWRQHVVIIRLMEPHPQQDAACGVLHQSDKNLSICGDTHVVVIHTPHQRVLVMKLFISWSLHLNHRSDRSLHLNHSSGRSLHLNHSAGRSLHLNHVFATHFVCRSRPANTTYQ